MPSLGLLRIPIDDSRYLLIQDPVVYVSLFGVEVLVKRCSDHTVIIDSNAVLLCQGVKVGSVSELKERYFRSPPSLAKIKSLPPFSISFLRSEI